MAVGVGGREIDAGDPQGRHADAGEAARRRHERSLTLRSVAWLLPMARLPRSRSVECWASIPPTRLTCAACELMRPASTSTATPPAPFPPNTRRGPEPA